MQNTSVKQKIALISFGLFLCIFFLEIGLRTGGFIILSLREEKNRCAFREKGVYRIMCLGGSTTADGGEYSYPSQLEKILNERNIGIQFKVINKGVEDADSTFILSQLKDNLDKYHPDAVITMMGENDGGATMAFEDSWKARLNLIITRIRVYKLAKLLWLHMAYKIQEIKHNELEPLNKDFANMNNIFVKKPDLFMDEHNDNSTMNSRILYERAILYKNERNFADPEKNLAEAIRILQKAIEIEPDNRGYYIKLADCYVAVGKMKEAEEILKKVIEKYPDNAHALSVLGWCYQAQGRYKESEKILKKAIETDCSPASYSELINTYKEAQDKQNELKELHENIMKEGIKNYFFAGLIATFYMEQRKYKEAKEYYRKANEFRQRYYNQATRYNYQRLKDIAIQRGIRLVCVQHATRNIEPLKRLFASTEGIIFVDNEKVFKDALMRGTYDDYFRDRFAGDFGHCTPKGNRLLAENVANTILKELFQK